VLCRRPAILMLLSSGTAIAGRLYWKDETNQKPG
jgi:hypothetical protein